MGLMNFTGELKYVLKLQAAFRKRMARKRTLRIRGQRKACVKGNTPVWVATWDPTTKAFFYYNKETRKVVWNRPDDYRGYSDDEDEKEELPPEWVELLDPVSGTHYYYNNFTSKCVWSKPKDFVHSDQVKSTKAAHLFNPQLRSVLMVQAAYRARR